MPTVALVQCVKTKGPDPAPACDLYTSPLFLGMRAYAESVADRWFILSAKHGLLEPTDIIAPYEQTLNGASAPDRRAWASGVAEALIQKVRHPARFVVLAGMSYRGYLVALLSAAGFELDVPMEGLKQGYQLQWLKAHNGKVTR